MDYKEINRLVELAREGGGYVVGGPAEDRCVEIGEKTGSTLHDGRPEIHWHKLNGVDAFDFVQAVARSYARDLEGIWHELREANLLRDGLTLLQHVHSLVRSLDDDVARSQVVQDELLDHVTIGSGEIEQTAVELRVIADRLDATSDKMDDMTMLHGSKRPLS